MEDTVEVFEECEKVCYVLLKRHSEKEILSHTTPKAESPELRQKALQANKKDNKTTPAQEENTWLVGGAKLEDKKNIELSQDLSEENTKGTSSENKNIQEKLSAKDLHCISKKQEQLELAKDLYCISKEQERLALAKDLHCISKEQEHLEWEENKEILENLLAKVVGGEVLSSGLNGETQTQTSETEEIQNTDLFSVKIGDLKGEDQKSENQNIELVDHFYENIKNISLEANECLSDICNRVIFLQTVEKGISYSSNADHQLQKKITYTKKFKLNVNERLESNPSKTGKPRLRNLPRIDFSKFAKLKKSRKKFLKRNFIKPSKEMADFSPLKYKIKPSKTERKRRKRKKARYEEDKEWKTVQQIDIDNKVLKVNTRRKRIESSSSDGEDIEENKMEFPGDGESLENDAQKSRYDSYVMCKIMREMNDFYLKKANLKPSKSRFLQNGAIKTRFKKWQTSLNDDDVDDSTPIFCIQQVVQNMVDTVCSFERKRQVVIDDYRKKKCKWCDIQFTPSCGNEYLCKVCQDVARISSQKTTRGKKRKQNQKDKSTGTTVLIPAPRGRPPKNKTLKNLQTNLSPNENVKKLVVAKKYGPRKKTISTPKEVVGDLAPSSKQCDNVSIEIEKTVESKEKEKKPKRKKKENEKKLVLTIGNKKVFKRMYVHSPCEVEEKKKLKRKSSEQNEISRKKSKRNTSICVEKFQLKTNNTVTPLSFNCVPNKETLDSILSINRTNLNITAFSQNQREPPMPQLFEAVDNYFVPSVSSVIVSNHSNNVPQNDDGLVPNDFYLAKSTLGDDTKNLDNNAQDESPNINAFAANDRLSFNQFTNSTEFNDPSKGSTNNQISSDDLISEFSFSSPAFSIDSNVANIFSSPYLTIEPSQVKSSLQKSEKKSKKLSFHPELQIKPIDLKCYETSSETSSENQELGNGFPFDDNNSSQESVASNVDNQEKNASPEHESNSSTNKSVTEENETVSKTVVKSSGMIKKCQIKPNLDKCVPTSVIAVHRGSSKDSKSSDEYCDLEQLRASGKMSTVSILCSELDAIGILGITDLAKNPKGYLQFLIESNKSEYEKLMSDKLQTTELKTKQEQCIDNRTTLLLAKSFFSRYGSFTKLAESTLRLANSIKIKKEKIEENEKQRSSCIYSQLQTTEPLFTAIEPSFNAIEPPFSAIEPAFNAIEPAFNAIEPAFSAIEPSFSAIEPSFSAIEPSFSAIEPSFRAIEPSFSELEPSINADSMIQYCKDNFPQHEISQPVEQSSTGTLEEIKVKTENNGSCSFSNQSQDVENPIENIQAQISAMTGIVAPTNDQWGGGHHFQVPSETVSYTDMSAAPRVEMANMLRDTPSRGSGPVTPGRPESAMSHVEDNMMTPLQIKKEKLENNITLSSTQCTYSQNTPSTQLTKDPSPNLSDIFSPINTPLTPMNSQLAPVNNQLTSINNQLDNQRFQNSTPDVSVSNHYSHVISPIYSQNTPQSPSTFLAPLNPMMNDVSSNNSQLMRALTSQAFQSIPPNVTIRNNHSNNSQNIIHLQNNRGSAVPNVTVSINSDPSYSNVLLNIPSKQSQNVMNMNTASQHQNSNVVIRNGHMYNVQRLYFPAIRQGQLNAPPTLPSQSETQSMNMSQFNNFKHPDTRYMSEVNSATQNSYSGLQMTNTSMENLQQVVQHLSNTSYQTQRNSQVLMENTAAIQQAAIPTSCVVCNKPATLRCKQCDKVGFCNATCGKTYWHTTHKMECCKT